MDVTLLQFELEPIALATLALAVSAAMPLTYRCWL